MIFVFFYFKPDMFIIDGNDAILRKFKHENVMIVRPKSVDRESRRNAHDARFLDLELHTK